MNPSLRSLAEKNDKFIGAAVNTRALISDPLYAETLSGEFNMITAENVMKFEILSPGENISFMDRPGVHPSRYNFQEADTVIDFARQHNMEVRGHTLVWHNQLPRWLSADGITTINDLTGKQVESILEEHIAITAGRYKGSIYAWDVVNEAVTEPTDTKFGIIPVTLPGTPGETRLRNTLWMKALGIEYLEKAFYLAHQADPKALLFYNDYNGENRCKKSDDIYNLVYFLKNKGVPIHGIGMQMHISLEDHPSPEDLVWNIGRFAELGLEIHITELDVRIKGTADNDRLAEQAAIYGEIADIVRSVPACRAMVTWGFTDKYSWIPFGFPGYDNGLLFNRDLRKKPAYDELVKVLSR